ncbi:XrtA/PEP-CTERM system-associated ATPase [Allosphingosinicella sp.]|uniref:XrtA/PEP-CTERM system-associated ATPase n=1 Tax=Allosphingosinicella sp. TaxID=2823234 RepID=UPI003783A472
MYTDHYGLTGQPFQLTPDARFWFDSRTHKKAMAYLGYGLAQGEGFIVVTGEIGAGKSTLVAHVMANIDRARLNAMSVVSTQVEGDDMLRLVAQGLGVSTALVEKAQLLDAVERRLEEELRAGKRNLLIVDEAQNLPVSALEELRMLSNFQIAGRALLQIVLLGQPEFRDKLGQPGLEQLRQRVIATHHLEAMDADEVAAYIRHRLTRVDWQGSPDFEPEAFAAVHRHSGGIPRKVNQLMQRVLLAAALENAELVTAAQVDAVAADLGVDASPRPVAVEPAPVAAPTPEPAPEEKVFSLRSARRSLESVPAPAPMPEPVIVADPQLEQRISALEARAEEQEATLRRVLILLVDWVENGSQDTAYRTHAA